MTGHQDLHQDRHQRYKRHPHLSTSGGPPNGHAGHCNSVHAAKSVSPQHAAAAAAAAAKEGRQPLSQVASALKGVEFIAQHIKKADKDTEVREESLRCCMPVDAINLLTGVVLFILNNKNIQYFTYAYVMCEDL